MLGFGTEREVLPISTFQYHLNNYESTKNNENWIDIVTLTSKYGTDCERKWHIIEFRNKKEMDDLQLKIKSLSDEIDKIEDENEIGELQDQIRTLCKTKKENIKFDFNASFVELKNRRDQIIKKKNSLNTKLLEMKSEIFIMVRRTTILWKYMYPETDLSLPIFESDGHRLIIFPSMHLLNLRSDEIQNVLKFEGYTFDGWVTEIDACRFDSYNQEKDRYEDVFFPLGLTKDSDIPVVLGDLMPQHCNREINGREKDFDARNRTMVWGINSLLKRMVDESNNLTQKFTIGIVLGAHHQFGVAEYLTENFIFEKPFYIDGEKVYLKL